MANKRITELDLTTGVTPSSLIVVVNNGITEKGLVSQLLDNVVGDVLEYADLTSFPTIGENGKIYVALDTNLTYRWSGTIYVNIGGGGSRKNIIVPFTLTDLGLTSFNEVTDAIVANYIASLGLVETEEYFYVYELEGVGDIIPDASSTTKGIAKLYNSLGQNIDGSVDQNTVTNALNNKIDIDGLNSNIDILKFDVLSDDHIPLQEGQLRWCAEDKTLDLGMGGGVSQQIGKEQYVQVMNDTSTIILNGTSVYANNVIDEHFCVAPFLASTGNGPNFSFVGLLTQDLEPGQKGLVTSFGFVKDIDTTGGSENWYNGQLLFASDTEAGKMTKEYSETKGAVVVGIVLKVGATDGIIFVRPIFEQEGFKEFIQGVEEFAGEIETALDTKVDKETIETNTTAGNILRADGVKFRSISEVEFLRPKLPHSKSPLGMALGYSFIENWGNTGENQTYKGDPYVLLGGFKSFDVALNRVTINLTFRPGSSDGSNNFYVALMKDADNYLEININRSTVNFSKVISGVKTNLLSQTQPIGILRVDVRSFELKITKDSSGTGSWTFTAFGSTVNAFITNGISEITDSENYTKIGFKSVSSGDADFIIYK
jgi:hypothetical protein